MIATRIGIAGRKCNNLSGWEGGLGLCLCRGWGGVRSGSGSYFRGAGLC